MYGNLYDFPHYYDTIFGFGCRDEVTFLIQCFQGHAQRNVRRIFEPACGTGRLFVPLSRRGFIVSGLDINQRALTYCNDRLARHGFSRSACVGDMTRFRLPRKVDAAFNLINTFRLLTSENMAVAHMRCVGDAVNQGGLYILGLHLTPTVGRPHSRESYFSRRGQLCVKTTLRTTRRDLSERLERVRITCDVRTPTKRMRIVDDLTFRTYTLRQLVSLFEKAMCFEIVKIYDFGYDIRRPIDLSPSTQDVVIVLRKRANR